jgi:hypothetical protein
VFSGEERENFSIALGGIETGIVKVNDWSWWERKLASGVS